MKKISAILLIFGFFVISKSFADDYEPAYILAMEGSRTWSFRSHENESWDSFSILKMDKKVQALKGPELNMINGKLTSLCYIEWDEIDGVYVIESRDLLPYDSVNLFPDYLISDVSNTSRKKWTCSYYLDVLVKGGRDALYTYEKDAIDFLERNTENSGLTKNWWEQYERDYERLIFFQAVISLGSSSMKNYWIINNESRNGSYYLTVQVDYYSPELSPFLAYNLPVPSYNEQPTFQLRLVPDGDYMDVYLDNETKKLATYVLVDQSILTELDTLIMTNSCNYGNITTWPSRANGVMDYPPPAKAKISSTSSQDLSAYSFTTTSNLRLRASADTKGSVITTIAKGDHVQLLEKGKSATIDGITAPWVQVKTQNGETGWCFGGYLDPRP